MSALPIIFFQMLHTHNFIHLIQITQYTSTVLSPLTRNTNWAKRHSLFWFTLMERVIKKVATELCVVTILVLVLTKVFVPFNSYYVRLEYNKILKPHFGEQGIRLNIFTNKPNTMT